MGVSKYDIKNCNLYIMILVYHSEYMFTMSLSFSGK